MLQGKLHITSWILLAYFAFIIVPPVSSFASVPNPGASSAARLSPKVRNERTALLLLDIIVWQSLKKTKLTQELVLPDVFSDANFELYRLSLGIESCSYLTPGFALIDSIGRCIPLRRQSRSSCIRFSRSGISPPVFSA
jgi:hypothetical protein